MGRHGENIRHRKNDNRWEGRYKVYDENRQEYVYRSVYGHSYAEVREKLPIKQLTIRNCISGSSAGALGSTALFSQAANEWLGLIREKCKYSTYIKYDTVYRTHLAGALGDCPLTDISDIQLQAEIPDDLSENMQKSIYSIANQILRYANSHYQISVPMLTRIPTRAEKKAIETLSIAEQAKLFDCICKDTDKYKIATFLSLCIGLRLGEICALKWDDIDFDSQAITINHTVQRITAMETVDEATRTNLLESDPKSDCSRRIIPVSGSLLQLLGTIRSDESYIFGGDKPLEPRTMQYQFKRILREALISERNFHILRHTFATNCVEKGIDVKSISEILGHSDVKITLNRYVHPTMDAKRLQLEQLILFYNQIGEQTH